MNGFNLIIPLKTRIADLNYGNHVGHHSFFLFFQDARIAYLKRFGCSEFDIGGFGMILAEASCRYKQELHLGDDIEVGCKISELRTKAFIMEYQIQKGTSICATGSTTNLCFDYLARRVVKLPDDFVKAVKQYEGLN
jgi:acyl-CoA thioester hydrolase